MADWRAAVLRMLAGCATVEQLKAEAPRLGAPASDVMSFVESLARSGAVARSGSRLCLVPEKLPAELKKLVVEKKVVEAG